MRVSVFAGTHAGSDQSHRKSAHSSIASRAYDGMTDASATQMVKFMGRDQPKLGVLINNNVHTSEHYGNLLTYGRMKRIVPPTSDPEFMQQLRK